MHLLHLGAHPGTYTSCEGVRSMCGRPVRRQQRMHRSTCVAVCQRSSTTTTTMSARRHVRQRSLEGTPVEDGTACDDGECIRRRCASGVCEGTPVEAARRATMATAGAPAECVRARRSKTARRVERARAPVRGKLRALLLALNEAFANRGGRRSHFDCGECCHAVGNRALGRATSSSMETNTMRVMPPTGSNRSSLQGFTVTRRDGNGHRNRGHAQAELRIG